MTSLSEGIRDALVGYGPLTIAGLKHRLAEAGVKTTTASLRQYLFFFRRLGLAGITGRENTWPPDRGPQHIWRGLWAAIPGRETDAKWAANPRSSKRNIS